MGDHRSRSAAPELLHYRPWVGTFRSPALAFWPIARTALGMLLRRWFFWVLYLLSLLVFVLFLSGQYLMAWAQTQLAESDVRVGGLGRANPRLLVDLFRRALHLDGSGQTYRDFLSYQGHIVMVVLALAGAVLIGNDLRFGSLPFYLAKPLARRHYLLGKGLAVAVIINLMTTLPALVLFVECGVLESWDYFVADGWLLGRLWLPVNPLLPGILGYGVVLSVPLTLLLLAAASWLRRGVPLVMAWTALFFFCRLLAAALVDGLHLPARCRLIDLWNDTCLVGNACLGLDPLRLAPQPQPAWSEAALVLGGVCCACLTYLILRIRAVEIVH